MILDVVYNHFGPDGNYLDAVLARTTSPTATRTTGARRSTSTARTPAPVREFFVANAGYWIDEFHLDGLRLDATQSIYDDSADHVIAAITREAREAAGDRGIVLIGEILRHAVAERPVLLRDLDQIDEHVLRPDAGIVLKLFDDARRTAPSSARPCGCC